MKKTEEEIMDEIFHFTPEEKLERKSFYYKEKWTSKTGVKYETFYCGLCKCYAIKCEHCKNGSCSGGGCEKCHEDFEEFLQSGLCLNLRENKEN